MQLSTQQPSLAETLTQRANDLYSQGASGNLGLSGQQLTSQMDTNIANQQQAVKNTQAINEAFSGYEGNVGFGLGGAALKDYQAKNANKLAYQDINSQAMQALAQLSDDQIKAELKAREDAAKAAKEQQEKDLDRKIELAKAGLAIDENGNIVAGVATGAKLGEQIAEFEKNYKNAENEASKNYWKQQLLLLGIDVDAGLAQKALSTAQQNLADFNEFMEKSDYRNVAKIGGPLDALTGKTESDRINYNKFYARVALPYLAEFMEAAGNTPNTEAERALALAASNLPTPDKNGKVSIGNLAFKKALDNFEKAMKAKVAEEQAKLGGAEVTDSDPLGLGI